jgi:peptide/nickel transport system substrate-binding protein
MSRAPLQRPRGIQRALTGSLGALAVGLVLSACGTATSGAGRVSGTINFAELPGASPDYIFPFVGCKYFSVSNINQFQLLMYRPVYWFGLGASTEVRYDLSLARAPVFNRADTKITINLKGWRFSDGQVVNATSVMFFLNMYRANPASYCGYNAGYGIPDELATAAGKGNAVTLTFTRAVSPNWILYNYLSELTPMPEAWDRTSLRATAGSGHCATGVFGAVSTARACDAVEKFLDRVATRTSTFTGPLWQVVDGPWRLSGYRGGNATFVPNRRYSGPERAKVARVNLVSFTTTASEERDLNAGRLTIGYVDPSVLPGTAPAPGEVGPNEAKLDGRYTLMSGFPWSFNYDPLNFSSSDPKGPLLEQLYIRQALQESINQTGIIATVDRGYGVPTCSPIPPNTPSSISATIPCAYRYDPGAAISLLASHGWRILDRVQTCTRPGVAASDCGPGIAAGTTLRFSFIWASGTPAADKTNAAMIAAWRSIGVLVSRAQGLFHNVVAQCDGGSFQICSWGAGWIYAPDYYPSGETLFTPGGSFNPGRYINTKMTNLVTASVTESVPLTAYGTYAATQLPVLYVPNLTTIIEVANALKGVPAPNPLRNFMPEYMHY